MIVPRLMRERGDKIKGPFKVLYNVAKRCEVFEYISLFISSHEMCSS
jgi:hypothetical protein